ncbi:MAG TPA: HlyD family efflux transporter periplasmic adaptor subunit [Bryobacteraceae bacterium]|nr:HlyD family efflux transporter periplasmic adaptor subunit [Bryobacteraceae bacterium]
MSRKWLIPVAALLAIGAGVIVWTRRAPAIPENPAPAVALPTEADLSGTVEPRNIVAVQPPAEGVLDEWAVEPGESVYKDQLLARVRVPKLEDAAQQAQTTLGQLQSRVNNLDSAETEAKLEISRADAEKARADGEVDRLKKIYDRYKGLWDLGAIARLQFEKSAKDYQDAQSAADNADKADKAAKDRVDTIEAGKQKLQQQIGDQTKAVDQAKNDLASGDLHAPADGIVVARQGAPGQPIDPSMQNLVQIATDLIQLQIKLTPSIDDLPRMHAGQTAMVHFGDDDFSGTIREIRGSDVIVDFSTSEPITKLGDTAQVRIKF